MVEPSLEAPLLRPPRPNDYARMAELATELGYASTEADMRRRLQLLTDDCFVRVAVSHGGEILGWISAGVERTLALDPCAEVTGLIVAEGRRSSGTGALLLAAAEDWARGGGFSRLRVRSNVIRTRAHGFYQRHGYAVIKTQHCLVKSLAPAIPNTPGRTTPA
ncbi:MAG: GNAT family N-acetyltransferase [Terriglobales bacterium]